MMTETAKIAGFGNDGQCVDRSDARDLSQELIILAVPQQLVGLGFDLIALPDQAACFVNDQATAGFRAEASQSSLLAR